MEEDARTTGEVINNIRASVDNFLGATLPIPQMAIPGSFGIMQQQRIITFNIETVKRINMEEGLKLSADNMSIPKTSEGVKLDTPEKVADYVRRKIAEKESDYSLQPIRNQIICISAKVNDEATLTMSGIDERQLLLFFNEVCARINNPRFVGFNSKSFDVKTLMRAYYQHRIKPPFDIREMIQKYNHDYHFDVRLVLTCNTDMAHGNLGDWCEIFGLPRPFGKGYLVASWVAMGDWESVERHCRDNVDCTYALYQRIKETHSIENTRF